MVGAAAAGVSDDDPMPVSEGLALVVAFAAALAACGYMFRKLRDMFRLLDRAESLLRSTAATVDSTAATVEQELTTNSGSSVKDQVDAISRQVETNTDRITTLKGLVALVASEMAKHDRKSREALAHYREALAAQGIDLPVAPQETTTDHDLDLYPIQPPPTRNGE